MITNQTKNLTSLYHWLDSYIIFHFQFSQIVQPADYMETDYDTNGSLDFSNLLLMYF